MAQHIFNLQRQPEDPLDHQLKIPRMIVVPRHASVRDEALPIYDQGRLGSCTSNAWLRMFRKYLKTYFGVEFSEQEFSRLYHYYRERKRNGTVSQDSGASMRDGGKSLQKDGVCIEKLWPYIVSKFATAPPFAANIEALAHKIPGYMAVNGLNGIKQILASQAAEGKPVGYVIGIEVYPSFETKEVARTGIIPMPTAAEVTAGPLGGHAIYGDAYDDDDPDIAGGAVSCVNSWGTGWGKGGFFKLPYAYIEKHAYDAWTIESPETA